MAATTKRWWSEDTVAVVTGSNKGIGFEIVRQLAKQGITTVMTCRDVDRGEAALDRLREEGLLVMYRQLDVSNLESVRQFAHWLGQQFGGIDILVNNASIFGAPDSPDLDNARKVMQTNYYGAKNVTEAILPLLRPSKSGARIVNVSSRLGQFSNVMKAIVRLTFDKIETLSEKKMEEVMKIFYIDAKQRKSDTWATMYPHYSVSKAFVNAYTRMLARDLADRPARARIFVNSFCPGYTQTDITAGQGIHNSCWSAERLFDSNHWVPKGFGSSGEHRILLLVRLSFAPRLALTKNKSGGQPHVTPCVEPVRNFREATRFTKLLEYVL